MGARRTVLSYIGLGSNVGERARHLAEALHALEGVGRVCGVASVYETDPVGVGDQSAYLNTVVAMETERPPEALMEELRRIESAAGRSRPFPGAPRTLDLDLLLYGSRRIARPGLMVPHPRMSDRAFVLVPLLELAPELKEPGTGLRYSEQLVRTIGLGKDGAAGDFRQGVPGVRRYASGKSLRNSA